MKPHPLGKTTFKLEKVQHYWGRILRRIFLGRTNLGRISESSNSVVMFCNCDVRMCSSTKINFDFLKIQPELEITVIIMKGQKPKLADVYKVKTKL